MIYDPTFQDVDNGTIMLWSGMMSILCSLTYLSFDSNSKIFFNHGSIDSTMVGQLFTLAAIGISGNWLATASYQLIDPTICAVLRAQEIVFAYVAQSLILHLIPCYISFIGASLVVLSAVAMPLEKLVLCKNT